MKFTEFEKETRITNFAKRCLLDVNYNEKGESYRVPVHEWARKCWRKAKTFEEFVELFFATDEEEINSYGDGETKVFVFKKGNGNFIYNMLNIHDWRCSCKGKIDIYHYDCGDDICATLEGSYSIYSENGNVIFVED